MYNIRLPKIATISGSEFKEEGSYQYGRNDIMGLQLKKFPKMKYSI